MYNLHFYGVWGRFRTILASLSFSVFLSLYNSSRLRALEWRSPADRQKDSSHKFSPRDPIALRFRLEQRSNHRLLFKGLKRPPRCNFSMQISQGFSVDSRRKIRLDFRRSLVSGLPSAPCPNDATFGFKLPANPVGEGKICITVEVDIIPSPTGLGRSDPLGLLYSWIGWLDSVIWVTYLEE